MTTERPFRIASHDEFPILDVGPYLAGKDGALEALASQVRDALERVGFMMWINHDLDQDTITSAFAGSKQFHDLPHDEKMKLNLNLTARLVLILNSFVSCRHNKLKYVIVITYHA